MRLRRPLPHRKLLVIDGRLGFTGGVGIADPWRGDARSPEEWRDTHYRDLANSCFVPDQMALDALADARGFAQQQRQVFEADWAKARKVSLQAWQNRPLLERAQERLASLLSSQLWYTGSERLHGGGPVQGHSLPRRCRDHQRFLPSITSSLISSRSKSSNRRALTLTFMFSKSASPVEKSGVSE